MHDAPIDLTPYMNQHACAPWDGDAPVQVEHLYDALTRQGWKIDREESNLMVALSRTWRAHGVKVWLRLQEFVCAPPFGEVERLEELSCFRFDPAELPERTMEEIMYAPEDVHEPWYPSHREEWAWLVAHGDPNDYDEQHLHPIALGELPETVRDELAEALAGAIRRA